VRTEDAPVALLRYVVGVPDPAVTGYVGGASSCSIQRITGVPSIIHTQNLPIRLSAWTLSNTLQPQCLEGMGCRLKTMPLGYATAREV
jgi:hypothetical protein